MAAPIVGANGQCTSAIQVAGPSSDATFHDREALSVEVRQAASALATRLG